MKRTKIVCTIGPTCESKEMIAKLIDARMNVARLNMSHSNVTEHKKRIEIIRDISKQMNIPIGIIADLQGPKIRIGKLSKPAFLKEGQKFILTTKDIIGNNERVNVSFKKLPESLNKGDKILIDDGLIELKVDEVNNDDIYTTVIRGGELRDNKGINLPHSTIKTSSLTEKDIKDVKFAVENNVDWIALSFVRSPDDIMELRALLDDYNADIPIISKIEKHEAVKSIDEIIKVSQGIMIARGDLGIEIPIKEVPVVQKMIIKKCNESSIPVITATQMLDSMIRNPIPTRAEATDVSNAVYDGTDAVMLSGETAFGKYPVEAVKTMVEIVEFTEQSIYENNFFQNKVHPKSSITEAIALSVNDAAKTLNASAIITATESGYTARTISKFRPQVPIIAVTTSRSILNRLTLSYDVFPLLIPEYDDINKIVDSAIDIAKKNNYIKDGDLVIITAGILTGVKGGTNVMRVYIEAEEIAIGVGYGDGVVEGILINEEQLNSISEGNVILYTNNIEIINDNLQDYNIKAVITYKTGIITDVINICREKGIPVVGGIEQNLLNLYFNKQITLDVFRGVVYKGKVNMPYEK